jgi:hypothetical protein
MEGYESSKSFKVNAMRTVPIFYLKSGTHDSLMGVRKSVNKPK